MVDISHRFVEVNGLRMHVAEAGSGPLVILLHGFPECWYSWRHQLAALAGAGFHAVAPDQRGYGRTGGPTAVEDYSILNLVGDVVGLVRALGRTTATLVGHDWGAPVAWHTALLRPDVVRGVVGVSVPHSRRTPKPTLAALRARFGDGFYQLHFQRPGVEKEFEDDLTGTFRRMLYGLSGEHPDVRALTVEPGAGFLDSWTDPAELPDWLTERDIRTYVDEFAPSGFTGPLNWYRNIDRNWALTAAWEGASITAPALFLTGERDPVTSWYDMSRLADSLRSVVPHLRSVEVYPGAGHWLQQERAPLVNAELVDFVASTS